MTLPIQRSLMDVLQWLGSQEQTEGGVGKKKKQVKQQGTKSITGYGERLHPKFYSGEKKSPIHTKKQRGFVEFTSTSNFVRLTCLTDNF